jgi:RNA polymerase sigma-70 factor, ECF subfamily
MAKTGIRDVTSLLADLTAGRPGAASQLAVAVYPELRRLARNYLRRERIGHTLQPTALVNEAFIRLFGSNAINWQNRPQFFAIAANQMRRILIDYARQAQAGKRGGKNVKVTLTEASNIAESRDEDVLVVHEALERLEALNPRAGRIVELRYFGGLGEEETAQVLEISPATARRDWRFARAWLFAQLTPGAASNISPKTRPN